jgi:hypothetical protein
VRLLVPPERRPTESKGWRPIGMGRWTPRAGVPGTPCAATKLWRAGRAKTCHWIYRSGARRSWTVTLFT